VKIFRLLFVLLPTLVLGQKSETDKKIEQIDRIYHSDSSHFVFDLTVVPSKITDKIMWTNDSLSRLLYEEREILNLKSFMANTYEKWNATDLIMTEHLPRRRFIYAIALGTKWIFTYEHGGLGSHYHIIYWDTRDNKSLTSAVMVVDSRQNDNLPRNKKIEEIKKQSFDVILNQDKFRLFNGRLVKNYDVF
jgi:hypothetical protein